jgi:RNA polymerase sigma-70 factor, ECF subfamily
MDELTELLLAARDGDRVALAAAIRRTQPEIWGFCRHLVSPDEADDVTQEVYLRAWRALPSFRGDASARTWLLSIARRTCAETVKRRQRRRLLAFRAAPGPDPVEADPGETVALQQLLATLDHDQRSAFVLTQLLGLTYAEAARVCDCQVGTIRSRVARARARLVERLRSASAQ